MAKIERDEVTGKDTTGHEWDGLKELNNPLPKWWLYVLYATIAWAFLWYVLYPSIPFGTDYWRGVMNADRRTEVALSIEAARGEQNVMLQQVSEASLQEIVADPDLYTYAVRGGAYVFADNCAGCHALGGAGQGFYPTLADDEWLWGGTLDEVYHTVAHGVRNDDMDSRMSMMPNFGDILSGEEVASVASYVLSLSGDAPEGADEATIEQGATLFAENCVACHGEQGMGEPSLGAPNLTDAIWLYGDTLPELRQQIAYPRHGAMPPWNERLGDTTVKMVVTYLHSLGGVVEEQEVAASE